MRIWWLAGVSGPQPLQQQRPLFGREARQSVFGARDRPAWRERQQKFLEATRSHGGNKLHGCRARRIGFPEIKRLVAQQGTERRRPWRQILRRQDCARQPLVVE